jgi:uncharacterized protein (DUF1810 family)
MPVTTTATPPKAAAGVHRFRRAQDKNWPRIARELATGRKETHWMWYVFPQLQGLAKSETAHHYGIRDKDEALAYLDDPVLRVRLAESATAVLRHRRSMFSDTDSRKLRSCMTLFREVVTDPALPDAVLAKWYGGELCEKTLDILSGRVIPKPWMPPTAAPRAASWAGTAQGRVEVRGQRSFWEAQVRKAQRRQAADGPMSPRQIRSYLAGIGLAAVVVDMIADRWIDDQNEASQQGWEARDAE